MTRRTPLLVLAFVCAFGGLARAQQMTTQDLMSGLTAEDLANALVGGGEGSVAVSNVTVTGHPLALGTFTNAPSCLGFESGVVLTSGRVDSAPGPNSSMAHSHHMGTPGDASLDAIVGGETHDAAVLEFDVTPPAGVTTLAFQYVFASEEYNDFVDSPFNDVFALFVNGENQALIPGTETAVSINTVNNGKPLGTNPQNPQFYVNNEFLPAPCNVEADGFTTVLTLVAPVTPNEPNHLKLAIADRRDLSYDSWIFIKSGSIVGGDEIVDLSIEKEVAGEGTPAVGADVEWLVRYANAGPDVATGVTIVDTLPPGTEFVDSHPPVCAASEDVVTCDVGDLDPEAGTKHLTITTRSSTAGVKTNRVDISAGDGNVDLDGGNNTATATIDLGCEDGAPCDDGNPCTQTDVCDGEVCVGSNPVVCTPLDACHLAGECDPTTGLCTNPPGNDGAACGDGDACNGDEVCQSGLCVAPDTAQALSCIAASLTGFVPNFESGSVSVLEPEDDSIVGTIPVPNGPWGVAVHPNGTEVWVTQRNGGTVSVLDVATGAVVATIPVGRTPLGVAIHPAGARAYVANYDDDRVSVIDTATRTVVGSIPVAAGPSAFAFNAAATRLYVSGFAADAVSVVDTASHAVLATVPTGVQPLGMALDRVRGRLYVANYEGASVTVIGAVSNTVLGTVPAGQRPFAVTVDPVRARVYVTNASSDSVTVVDGAGLGVTRTIAEVGRAPFGIGLDLTGDRAFVANAGENRIAVLDTNAGAVLRKVEGGAQPIAFGDFLAPLAADCPLPAPVCTDNDPTTSETCSATDGCLYALRGAGGSLTATLAAIGETLVTGAGQLGGKTGQLLQQRLDAATGQVTPVIGTLTPDGIRANAARPKGAVRKRLKRIDRALRKFLRVLQKGLRRKTVQRDIGLRLLDLGRAAQSATKAALGGQAVVAPKKGLLTPLALTTTRTARPRPPLP